VERWFGLMTDRMIRRGIFHSVAELERAIYHWPANWNHERQPFILESHGRCHPRQGAPL